MPCPFIVPDVQPRCSAGQTAYAPQEHEVRVICSNERVEEYRRCKRYRQTVWSGLTPSFLDPPKRENGT